MVMMISLYNRNGDAIDHCLVDDEDFEWLSQWRWSKKADGYAFRSEGPSQKPVTIRMARAILGLTQATARKLTTSTETGSTTGEGTCA